MKNSNGSSLTVFMIAPQARLTGPSEYGMSTELDRKSAASPKLPELRGAYSSHSLTLSSWPIGIVLTWIGVRVKSWKTKTISKFLSPYCTRSRWATSMSASVSTRKGGSVRYTSVSVVGCRRTFDRKGTPEKASSVGTSARRGE